jgi:hypothetical protein
MDASGLKLGRSISMPDSRSMGKAAPSQTIAGQLREFFYPSTRKERTKRFGQYKDLGIFIASTALIFFFQEKLQQIVANELEDAKMFAKNEVRSTPRA